MLLLLLQFQQKFLGIPFIINTYFQFLKGRFSQKWKFGHVVWNPHNSVKDKGDVKLNGSQSPFISIATFYPHKESECWASLSFCLTSPFELQRNIKNDRFVISGKPVSLITRNIRSSCQLYSVLMFSFETLRKKLKAHFNSQNHFIWCYKSIFLMPSFSYFTLLKPFLLYKTITTLCFHQVEVFHCKKHIE